MADVLRGEPRTAGGLSRRLGLGTRGRAGMAAFVAGLAGALAFTASLVVDWQHVTVGSSEGVQVGPESQFAVGLDASDYGAAYLVGVLGLLTMLGLVLARPAQARQLRVGVAALGLGVIGVLVAITDQLQDVMYHLYGFRFSFMIAVPQEIQESIDNTTFAPLPGLFLAFAAVILLVAAAWLAGESGRRTANPAVAGSAADPTAEAPVSPAAPVADPATDLDGKTAPADLGVQVGYVDGLTVTPSSVTDPGTQPDILRN